MRIGILLPGFSANEDDWAIPVQQHLVQKLAARHDVRVIALRYPHQKQAYQLGNTTIYPLGFGAQARGLRRLQLWQRAFRLIRRLHHEKPFDILHAMWADETGLVTAWSGRWLGIKTVVSIAGGELAYLPDIGYGLQLSAFSHWTVGQALKGATAITLGCCYMQKRLQACSYDIPKEKVYILPQGVDTAIFHPDGTAYEPNRLIHVASLVPVKAQHILLDAIAQLPQVQLDIIGDGARREELETLAQQLNINNRVYFLGKVHHLNLPHYYRRAALHILTSLHEGQGMVSLEAAACGTPTISTNVGIVPDDRDLGISVPINDSRALAKAIQQLLNNPTELEAQRQKACDAVKKRYTLSQTVEQLEHLYQKIMV